MDMSQYKNLFLSEAREYLKTINETVIALEETPSDRSAVDALFRGAHSLKGMASSMDYGDIVEVAHSMEDLMLRVRDEGIPFDAGVADLLFEGTELIEGLIGEVEQGLDERRSPGDFRYRVAAYTPRPPELLPTPQAPPDLPPSPAPEPGHEPAGEVSTVRVATELLDHLINLTGELITNKHRLMNAGRELASPPLDEALAETAKLLRTLHDEVMKVRLMPFDAIGDRFQRTVRTLAKKSGKELHFELAGLEIGLDRGILEQLVDPLNHILRNAVDHGMEGASERAAAGKPAKGTVKLTVGRDRDRVIITVEDDGRGMDPEAMIAAALEKGLIAPEEAERLSPRQALMLACIPGFSTAKRVTDISGRGVGMDAVNSSIQKLGGTLAIDSKPGQGSVFTLRLPTSIAIIHALVVQCGDHKVAVPVSSVHRTVELSRDQLESVGRRRMFRLGEETIPILSLNRILGLPLGRFRGGFLPLFVTEARGRRVGMAVDRLLGQHELFVKPLGRPLCKLPGVAGGATLGDGEIVTILDVADLL